MILRRWAPERICSSTASERDGATASERDGQKHEEAFNELFSFVLWYVV